MRRFALALLATLPLIATGEIYKWTDENGRVNFGDRPQNQDRAERLPLRVNSYESVNYEKLSPTAASTSKRVFMYSAAWCGYCKQARQYFQQSGISFIEHDIEKDSRARQAYDALGGNGVPIILVGERRMNGFSVTGFQRIYQ
ncbi:glutaredoxin domain-containing protein [Pseudomonas sp. NCCP-436]|uniref:glutaredoxin domain-containing protein n=1 Tax=Pseudomonas sp. NCCP-436 TaxID=2842481 RepID=UPI001C8132A9|nr:glutaredoxin domain-containing protein [Pseudomonas sp. NCCP-436]GIZ11259.1 NrdH-like redox domain-containing protein [Pseudomonas sp. NCCP-436]